MGKRADDRKSLVLGEDSRDPYGLLSKISPSLSYLVLLATALYYGLAEQHGLGRRAWQQQSTTLFAQSGLITSIYWAFVLLFQLAYVWSLWSANATYAVAAARVSGHFVTSSVLLSAFIHLWVRSHFWLAELLLLASFFNLSLAYFRHPHTPLAVHVGAVAGPLAWNFAALYWTGAVAFRSTHLLARVAAHLSIWGWLGYGAFYLATYKDYVVGFALSTLSLSTGVGTSSGRIYDVPLQSAFAFAIGGTLLIVSLAFGFPGLLGHEPFPRGRIISKDREWAPLLACDE